MAPKGKPFNAGKKESLKKKTVQATDKASDLETHIQSTSDSRGLMPTADLEDTKSVGDPNQGKAADANENFNMNGNSNGINSCGAPVKPTAKIRLPTSPSSGEAKEKREPAEQKRNPPRHPMIKSCDQLKPWRGLKRCHDDESTDLSTTLDTIRDSIEELTSEYSGAVPVSHDTDTRPPQSSRTIVSQLLATPRAEASVFVPTFPSEPASRFPEWRHRVRSLAPLMGDGTAQDGFGDAQFNIMTSPKPELAYDLRRAVLESEHRNGPSFNRAVRTPLPPMGSYAYTSGPHRPPTSNLPSAVNNENSRPAGPRTAPNRIGTIGDHLTYALNPAVPPFNQQVTQTIPATAILRPMELTSNQLFPFPTYPDEENGQTHTATPSVHSTIHVTNDLSSQFASSKEQTEFEITGYRRSDPTVLWADSVPPAIAAPEERYPASRLLGDGFLSSLALDADSIVEPDAPSTLPQELREYLVEKAKRSRLHAEGDLWRARYAAEVVRHHEENVFQKRAEEGDWGLRRWHMSGEYHGQPGYGKGNRGGFTGPRGRGGGRGGRGRGRGGMGMGLERV